MSIAIRVNRLSKYLHRSHALHSSLYTSILCVWSKTASAVLKRSAEAETCRDRSRPVPTVFQSNNRWARVALQKLCITMSALRGNASGTAPAERHLPSSRQELRNATLCINSRNIQ